MSNNRIFNVSYAGYAWKSALALTITASIALIFHYKNFWWAVFITFVSIQPTMGTSLLRAWQRFLGTTIGVILGFSLALIYQLPWLYYGTLIAIVFVILYFSIRPQVQVVGVLILLTTLVTTILGPTYVNGIAHYAIERWLQIILALSVTGLLLFLFRFEHAYLLLRRNMAEIFLDINDVFNELMTNYVTDKHLKRLYLRQKIVVISGKITAQYLYLAATRFEARKKHFNRRAALNILQSLRRLLALVLSFSEAGRYCQIEQFTVAEKQQIGQVAQEIEQAFRQLGAKLNEPQYHQQSSAQLSYSHADILAQRLDNIVENLQKISDQQINTLAWFAVIKRIFYVLNQCDEIIDNLNHRVVNSKIENIENELHWITGKGQQLRKEQRYVRWHFALQGALTFAILLCLQQYYLWNAFIPVFGTVIVMFVLYSNYLPNLGNMGIGIVGALLSALYVWIALHILNYYPYAWLLLLFMFLATFVSAYFYAASMLGNGKCFLAALFGTLLASYIFMQVPEQRANLNLVIYLVATFMLVAILLTLISRWVFPMNHLRQYRYGIKRMIIKNVILLHRELLLPKKAYSFYQLQIDVYHLVQRSIFLRTVLDWIQDRGLLSAEYYKRWVIIRFYNYLVTLSLLNIAAIYHQAPSHQYINQFLDKLRSMQRQLAAGLLLLGRYFNGEPPQQLPNYEAMKQQVRDHLSCLINDMSRVAIDRKELLAMASLYNSFCRIIDLQKEMLQVLATAENVT